MYTYSGSPIFAGTFCSVLSLGSASPLGNTRNKEQNFPRPAATGYEQALVCLSNREIVDASRGCTFHCKMANNRLMTV